MSESVEWVNEHGDTEVMERFDSTIPMEVVGGLTTGSLKTVGGGRVAYIGFALAAFDEDGNVKSKDEWTRVRMLLPNTRMVRRLVGSMTSVLGDLELEEEGES